MGTLLGVHPIVPWVLVSIKTSDASYTNPILIGKIVGALVMGAP